MKRTMLSLALALAFGGAYAGNNSNNNDGCQGNCPNNGGGTVTSTNTNRNDNTNVNANANTNVNSNKQSQGQAQGQKQGQFQGQAQGQTATGGNAVNKGNTQSTTIEFKDQKQAPGVAIGATTTTASCRVAISGALSLPGVGVGIGSALKDEKCDKRMLGLALIDAARVAHGMGAPVEVYSDIFMQGLAMLRDSGVDETPAQETAVTAAPQSYVQ